MNCFLEQIHFVFYRIYERRSLRGTFSPEQPSRFAQFLRNGWLTKVRAKMYASNPKIDSWPAQLCFKILICTLIMHLVKSAYQKNNFLISQQKHMLWVLKRTVSMRRLFWAPKTYVKTDE